MGYARLERLPVRIKLLILVAIPTIATVIATQQEFTIALERAQQIDQFDAMAAVTVAGGNLVHELQKERGMSAGFISSQGQKFAKSLPSQRALTDEKLSLFKTAVESLGDVGGDYQQGLTDSSERLAILESMRGRVSGLEVKTGDAVAYYTAINTDLLTNIFRLSHRATNGDISRMAVVYGNFASSKERAGIERALFAVTFNLDRFTRANELRILQLINEQDLFLTLFRKTATAAQLSAFEQVSRHPDYIETQRYRDLAFDLRTDFGVDSELWFETITGKINQLRSLEGSLADDLLSAVKSRQGEADSKLMLLIGGSAAFLIITGGFALLIIRQINRHLGAEPADLIDYAEHIADGRTDRPESVRRESTGILRSMSNMQTILVQRTEEEQRQSETIARLMRSLDKIATAVLVTDIDGVVTYANAAFNHYGEAHGDALRAQLQGFDMSDPIGSNASVLLGESVSTSAERGERVIERSVDQRILKLTANTVIGDDDQIAGTVIELNDITEERRVVEDVSATIAQAANGNLNARVPTEGKSGVILTLSTEINNLLEVTEDVTVALGNSLHALADGDLSYSADRNFKGAFAELVGSVGNTMQVLKSVVEKIQTTTTSVQSATAEISSGTEDLSNRTRRASGVLKDTAERVRVLADTVSSNAERTDTASSLVDEARAGAEEGGAVVDEAVAAMNSISASSHQIVTIIEVIDEISFQTNLLALNASVEAARAGEHGRGFAVVASEVRNLASRSADAAKQIKTIIQKSSEEVAGGVELVNRTGEKLHEIVAGVRSVNAIFSEISERSGAQVDSIASIRSQLDSLDADTRENTTLVAESSAATQRTMSDVTSLTELMKFFQVDAEPMKTKNNSANAPKVRRAS